MRYSKDKINDILITWYSGKPQNNRSPRERASTVKSTIRRNPQQKKYGFCIQRKYRNFLRRSPHTRERPI